VFHAARYMPELVNTEADLADVERRFGVAAGRPARGCRCVSRSIGTRQGTSSCLTSAPLGRMLCVRRASDILDKYVGGTEHQIAEAFEEARRDGAFLLFDEADSFSERPSRGDPVPGVTAVNEFVQATGGVSRGGLHTNCSQPGPGVTAAFRVQDPVLSCGLSRRC